MANTLAYYDMATITAVTNFIVQTPGFITLVPDKAIPNTAVIYPHILTLEKEGTTVNCCGIFKTFAPS